tara:strand:- start:3069 stop:3272 length:204 start_codon:yes stop_codon:yes gene_type:complete
MFKQEKSDLSFIGEKFGYIIGLLIFTSILYWLTAKHWILGNIPYITLIALILIIYSIIVIIQVIKEK